MRTYKKTHPWLDFVLDLRSFDYTTWLLLGEASSKIEHIAGVPLEPELASKLHLVYLAKGIMATTAIEGNTLSEAEVRDHLDGKLKLPPSREYLAQEVDNIVAACNSIGSGLLHNTLSPLHVDDIKYFNKQVLHNLPLQGEVIRGKFRKHSVTVGRYRGAPPEDCEFLMEKFCHWLNEMVAPRGLELHYAIIKAIAAHLYFVWIHPFSDGNGRTARLIELRLLLSAGVPTPAAHLLSNFYNQTRSEYYRQLDHASKSEGKIDSFISYALRGFVDQLREQLNDIRAMQWEITWRNYVYERFGKGSEANLRRRTLVLELSKSTTENGWVIISDIPMLSASLAIAYKDKTRKTLTRDLSTIARLGLIEHTRGKVRAKREIILAFLPPRITQPNRSNRK